MIFSSLLIAPVKLTLNCMCYQPLYLTESDPLVHHHVFSLTFTPIKNSKPVHHWFKLVWHETEPTWKLDWARRFGLNDQFGFGLWLTQLLLPYHNPLASAAIAGSCVVRLVLACSPAVHISWLTSANNLLACWAALCHRSLLARKQCLRHTYCAIVSTGGWCLLLATPSSRPSRPTIATKRSAALCTFSLATASSRSVVPV